MKFTLHCPVVSEVMSEVCLDDFPGVRLLGEDLSDEREVVPAPVKSKAPRRSPWLLDLLRVYPVMLDGELEVTKVR